MISNIRKKVGVASIGLDKDTILVITVFGCVEPKGAVFFIAFGFQLLLDPCAIFSVTDGFFGSVDILVNMEVMEILFDGI